MELVTLAEAKERLSIDFDYKDGEIENLVNSIEGYLSIGTGLKLKELEKDSDVWSVARAYVMLRLYLDYYGAHTEIDDKRLGYIINQLKVAALC